MTNLAKLEGVYNQDPLVVLYDTYYGRKPLFDEPHYDAESSWTLNVALVGWQPDVGTFYPLFFISFDSEDTVNFNFGGGVYFV